jgi:hypothetical protein
MPDHIYHWFILAKIKGFNNVDPTGLVPVIDKAMVKVIRRVPYFAPDVTMTFRHILWV